jgi:hypothetical protein
MMKFEARIKTVDGGHRVLEHESSYDATAVLEAEINSQLAPGEEIVRVPARALPDALKHDRDLKATVPAITRVREAA